MGGQSGRRFRICLPTKIYCVNMSSAEFYNCPMRSLLPIALVYALRPSLLKCIKQLRPKYLDMLRNIEVIEQVAKTSCGYATVKDVTDHSLEDRMESFFLSETTKFTCTYCLIPKTSFTTTAHRRPSLKPPMEVVLLMLEDTFLTQKLTPWIQPLYIAAVQSARMTQKKLRQANLKEADLDQETIELNNFQTNGNQTAETDGETKSKEQNENEEEYEEGDKESQEKTHDLENDPNMSTSQNSKDAEHKIEFKDLMKSTEHPKLSSSTTLQKALKRIRRSKIAKEIPISEVVCEDCCVPLDDANARRL
uniref:Uncharacterized protein n=1 Tax=Ditylenchus dipsaci TaxID=166011 RepID=A0A915DMA8_9BILA